MRLECIIGLISMNQTSLLPGAQDAARKNN